MKILLILLSVITLGLLVLNGIKFTATKNTFKKYLLSIGDRKTLYG
jgi:hypothetical protein